MTSVMSIIGLKSVIDSVKLEVLVFKGRGRSYGRAGDANLSYRGRRLVESRGR